MEDITQFKAEAAGAIDEAGPGLFALSDWMFEHPELGLQEFQASERLSALLERSGAIVERGIAGLPTAFRATIPTSQDGPTIAIIAEYDALPGVGHGCGHNVIANAAMGAAIGLLAVKDRLPGKVIILGCPAEESAVPDAGGKIYLLESGYFDEVDAAIMIHPMTENRVTATSSLVAYGLLFEYYGRPAHAAAAPYDGINALDAVIQTFNGISALRQQLKPDVRIHGVITDGGEAPNVIPPYTAARFRVRSADPDYAWETVRKVVRCAEAGAMAAGARLEWRQYVKPYLNMISSQTLAGAFATNLKDLGLELAEGDQDRGMASTDFGNVSHRIPCITANLKICGPEAGWHSQEVAQATTTEEGHNAIVYGAKGLSATAIDLVCDAALLRQAKDEHAQAMADSSV